MYSTKLPLFSNWVNLLTKICFCKGVITLLEFFFFFLEGRQEICWIYIRRKREEQKQIQGTCLLLPRGNHTTEHNSLHIRKGWQMVSNIPLLEESKPTWPVCKLSLLKTAKNKTWLSFFFCRVPSEYVRFKLFQNFIKLDLINFIYVNINFISLVVSHFHRDNF